jgi:hypothetical protein
MLELFGFRATPYPKCGPLAQHRLTDAGNVPLSLCENSEVTRATSKFRGLSPRRARKFFAEFYTVSVVLSKLLPAVVGSFTYMRLNCIFFVTPL